MLQFKVEDCLMNKKMLLNFFFLFLVSSYVNCKCTVNFEAAKVCKFYRFDSVCDLNVIDNLDEFCSVLKITRNEKKCPIFRCTSSSSEEQTKLQPTLLTHSTTKTFTQHTTKTTAQNTIQSTSKTTTQSTTLITTQIITTTKTQTTTESTTLQTTSFETYDTTKITTLFLKPTTQTFRDISEFEVSTLAALTGESEGNLNENFQIVEERNDDSLSQLSSPENLKNEDVFQEEQDLGNLQLKNVGEANSGVLIEELKSEIENFHSMSSEEVICEGSTCYLEYHFERLCSIVTNNGTDGCSVPCNETLCTFEIRRNIQCPKWLCIPLPTPTTTTSTTTTTIIPSTPGAKIEEIMISSLVVNVILAFVVVVFALNKFKAYQRRRLYHDPEQDFLESDDGSHRPIIRPQISGQPQDHFVMRPIEPSNFVADEFIDLSLNNSAILNVNAMGAASNMQSLEENPSLNFLKFEEKKSKHRNRIV